MLLLDVHRTFRKTGKKIDITKFQKVEFFFCVYDSVIHIHIFLNLFSIISYDKILIIVPVLCSKLLLLVAYLFFKLEI